MLTDWLARHGDLWATSTLLLASYGHLGREAEARALLDEVLKRPPDDSIETNHREWFPYKNDADYERLIDGLRKAGVPE